MTEYLIKVKKIDVDPAVSEDKTKKTPLDKLFRQYVHIAKLTGVEIIDNEEYFVHSFTDKVAASNFGRSLIKSRHYIETEVIQEEELNGIASR